MDKFRISLENVEFFAHIGVAPQEQKVGNLFRVSVAAEYDAALYVDEQLDSTISYADIYDIVAAEMARTFSLLETGARNIASSIMTKWPAVNHCSVKIVKCSAPISGISGECCVEYEVG